MPVSYRTSGVAFGWKKQDTKWHKLGRNCPAVGSDYSVLCARPVETRDT